MFTLRILDEAPFLLICLYPIGISRWLNQGERIRLIYYLLGSLKNQYKFNTFYLFSFLQNIQELQMGIVEPQYNIHFYYMINTNSCPTLATIILIFFISYISNSQLLEMNQHLYSQLKNPYKQMRDKGSILLITPKNHPDPNQLEGYKVAEEIVKDTKGGIQGLQVSNNNYYYPKIIEWLNLKNQIDSLLLVYITRQSKKYLYNSEVITKVQFYRFIKKVQSNKMKEMQHIKEENRQTKKKVLEQLKMDTFEEFMMMKTEKVIRFYCSPEKPYPITVGVQFVRTGSQFEKFRHQIRFAEIDVTSNRKLIEMLRNRQIKGIEINYKQLNNLESNCQELSSIFFWGTESQVSPIEYQGEIKAEYIAIWIKNYSQFTYAIPKKVNQNSEL